MALVLQKQWDYYLSKEEEFLKNCYGKFIVISEKLDVYVMDTIGDAYKLGCAAFGLGNFLIQEAVVRVPECIRAGANPLLRGKKFVKREDGYHLEKIEKEEQDG